MTVALIVAAGSGERLGAERPKALVQVAGQPLYRWSLQALLRTPEVQRIAIALPPGHDVGLSIAAEGSAVGAPPVLAAAGGTTRSDSVRRALAAVGPGDPVLVHDAARPLLTPQLASSVIEALLADGAAAGAIAAAPVTDTVKRAGSDLGVIETLDRSGLWAVQTPQVFRREALERALDVSLEELHGATDDASLVEREGGRVILVPGGPENLKVTTPTDLLLAELLLRERSA